MPLILEIYFQLFSQNFSHSDSLEHQLISIVYGIWNFLRATPNFELRSVFLNISKVFDRGVEHSFLVEMRGYNWKWVGITENLLKLIESLNDSSTRCLKYQVPV